MRIPLTAKEQLSENRFAILDSASRVGKKELELLAKTMEGSTYGRERIVYKVRSGDVLGSIAMRHRVRVADIKKWNNLRSDVIRSGQRLNIWVKSSTSTAIASAPKPATRHITTDHQGRKTYVVQPGDTLWDISKKFDGLTIEKIKSLNKLSNTRIQPGQKLIVGI
jgi:membrane-bound lytic murein transglycosylase D